MKNKEFKSNNSTKIISVDEGDLKEKLNEMVRDTFEETLNMLLDQEAELLCNEKNMRERRTDGTGEPGTIRGDLGRHPW